MVENWVRMEKVYVTLNIVVKVESAFYSFQSSSHYCFKRHNPCCEHLNMIYYFLK